MAKTPRPATDTGISIGQVFLGKYRVEEILGQGGMGIVARCTHLALDEQVAIKMLRPDVLMDEDATSRFMREAQAAVKLRSEYVARVSDVGTFENGVPYMVMEFLDGQDLGVLVEQQGCVAAQWATDLMLQTCEALAEAHSIGIVHRDVKPSNLFVTWRPDGTSLIKVLDFGISKSPMGTDMQLTQTQSLLGTPAYMSPEQMRSARLVDQRTDIWSLGTVMYELLEGRRPFEAESFSEMCVKVAVDPPSPMVNTPPALQQVVLRCLAKSPEQRYQNMAELGRDLIPFARDPHAAQMMVDRMVRMLGRSSATNAGWDVKTPVPSVRAASPAAAWHGGSDPAAAPLDAGTLREKSAPALQPVEGAGPKRRSGLVIGLVAVLGIAAGLIAVIATRDERDDRVERDDRGGENKVAVPAPSPAPADAAPAVIPTPPPADDTAKVATPADDVTPDQATKPDQAKPDQAKKPPAITSKGRPSKSRPQHGQKANDKTVPRPEKDKLLEPAATPPIPAPKPKADIWSTPRPPGR